MLSPTSPMEQSPISLMERYFTASLMEQISPTSLMELSKVGNIPFVLQLLVMSRLCSSVLLALLEIVPQVLPLVEIHLQPYRAELRFSPHMCSHSNLDQLLEHSTHFTDGKKVEAIYGYVEDRPQAYMSVRGITIVNIVLNIH